MKRITTILLAALVASCGPAPAYAGNATPPPVETRIVCTVPTPWDPQACWVEFNDPALGQRVEVASQAEAEELVAILLANSGSRYVFDDDVPPMSLPLPATLQLKRPPLKRDPADKR